MGKEIVGYDFGFVIGFMAEWRPAIDIAQGPRGGREPIKRVSNEALRALCAPAPPSPAAAPAADRRSLSGAFTPRDPRPPGL